MTTYNFEQWVKLCKRQDGMKMAEKCPDCDGVGGDTDIKFVKCERCDGSGYEELSRVYYVTQRRADEEGMRKYEEAME